MAADSWEPFGIPEDTWADMPEHDGVKWVNVSLGKAKDRSSAWLRGAMVALGLLAAASAVVSFQAQFVMVYRAKHSIAVAALEAGIPDAAALVFASLGVALALHGRRAIRARVLNVGAVATSLAMNLLAAEAGWRNVAIWVMPPIAYALTSDTAIGVIRAWTLARQREQGEALAEDESTPLTVLTGLLLWALRLGLAPASTLRGFRAWVLDECPVAPGRRVLPAVTDVTALPAAPTPGSAVITRPEPRDPEKPARPQGQRGDSKTGRVLQLVPERYGAQAGIDVAKVSRIAADLAPEVGLNTGSARSALRPLVLAAQNGHSQ